MNGEADERAWQLAEQFDHAARRDGPGRQLLAEVAATCDLDIRVELMECLEALAADDRAAADRYGTHLVALAALLPAPEDRITRAMVDMVLAEAIAMADDWPEATRRLTRCRRDVDELMPAARPDWEWIMGGGAEHVGRYPDARRHWRRARELFVADERWYKAAQVSEALAMLHGEGGDGVEVVVEQALADWRAAADHYATAGVLDEARGCVERAAELVNHTVAAMRPGEEARVYPLAVAVREPALRHGAVAVAAGMAAMAGMGAPEAGRTLDEARALFTEARTGFRSLPDDSATRVQLAWVDAHEARTLMAQGWFRDAEPLLHDAVRVFRAEDVPGALTMCETMLTGVLGFVEQDLERVSKIVTNQQWSSDEGKAAAAMLRAMTLFRDGLVAQSLAAFAEAVEHARATGAQYKAAGFAAMAGAIALAHGDPGPARRSVAELGRCLAPGAPTLPTDGVRALSGLRLQLLADLAGHGGDRATQLRHLHRLEELLLSFDSGLIAAMTALRRARLLLAAGEYRDALTVGLPAVLALDAVRFTLPDAQRRGRWAATVAEGFDTAFRAAAGCGDATVLAELLEVVRGNAVPLPDAKAAGRGGDEITESLGALLAPPAPSAGADGPPGALTGAELLAGGESSTVLGLPPYVRTPWDTVALAEPLQRARRYHDPVRADVVVGWHVIAAT